jgi:AcrR family transcriptional regulator
MSRPRTIDDEELLEISRQVFLGAGLPGATRKIAERAGISEAAIYKRFRTQRDLFIAAMMPPEIDVAKILSPSPTSDSHDELVAIAERALEYLRSAAPHMLLGMLDPNIRPEALLSEKGQNPLSALRGAVKQFFYPWMKDRHLSVVGVERLSNVLVLALFGVATMETLGLQNEVVRESSAVAVVDALWHGLQGQPAKRHKR